MKAIPNADLESVFFRDDRHGWTAGSRQRHGVIFRSGDAGESWKLQHEVKDFRLSSINAVTFCTVLEGWAVGNAEETGSGGIGFILHTLDGGRNWRLQYERPNQDGFRALRFITQQEGWVLGTSDIIHTSDGGHTWKAQRLAALTESTGFDLEFVSASQGWVVGGIHSSQLLHTMDGGATWTDVSPNLHDTAGSPLFYYNVKFASPSQGWVAASAGVVLSTADGGRNWTIEHNGSSQAIGSLSLGEATLFAAGVDGVISTRPLP